MAESKTEPLLVVDDVRTCFVIMPFRTKTDVVRSDEVNFDKIYEDIIKRGVERLNNEGLVIKCIRSDEVERAGLIQERMIEYIADADVAVVDITTQNPNVFYELGVRHALRDRVTVLLRRKGTPNPFNIAGMTAIEYDLGEEDAERAREAIANFVRNGLLSGAKDSLVYAVLPGLKAGRDPKPIVESDLEEYAIPRAPGKRIGIVSGNLRHTNLSAKLLRQPIDVWVSSENINMQMARPYEASVSGLIRYLGAQKDETGSIVEDVVAKELHAKMKRRQLVNPGEVVSTGAGRLADTHNVKRIFHAAAVYGVVGTGYHPIVQIEQCITNALARIDLDAKKAGKGGTEGRRSDTEVKSILFPLMGTGTARAEIIQSARRQLQAAISYLRSRAEFTQVERVYFLAPTEAHRAGLRVALAELGVTRPEVPSEKINPSVTPVKAVIASRAKRKQATRRARA
jgi:O-acetyl-ADP-ribose deacetylase (regulator of RNase III)